MDRKLSSPRYYHCKVCGEFFDKILAYGTCDRCYYVFIYPELRAQIPDDEPVLMEDVTKYIEDNQERLAKLFPHRMS